MNALSVPSHALAAACLLAVLAGCAEVADPQQPFVLDSAASEARWTIDLNRVLDGVFRGYRPRCLDSVRIGHTVEFRNFAPDLPANVTSLSVPDGATPLFSPNLVAPYNYVSRDDEGNSLCEVVGADRSCQQAPHWSYWRYTFEVPGVYDWIDTNSSEPGRKVVDPYYGTVTFVGIDPSSPFGTVCVEDEQGEGCAGICCTDDTDCDGGQQCFRLDVDAVGRCLTPSG